MHPDVQALLALQVEDLAIREIEARRAALEPRLREMETTRRVRGRGAHRAREAVEAEEKSAARSANADRPAQAAARAQRGAARLR